MELNKELLEKVKKMKTPEELLTFAEENSIEMTKEKADAYFKQLGTSSGNIADDELENVSGGKFDEMEDRKLPPGWTCPNCGKYIPKTITDLVQPRLRCPYCLSIINIDRENPEARK